jgi:hypothetical protein
VYGWSDMQGERSRATKSGTGRQAVVVNSGCIGLLRAIVDGYNIIAGR